VTPRQAFTQRYGVPPSQCRAVQHRSTEQDVELTARPVATG
jgi:hypothetical protein